jgi:hypothetical protein
VPIGAHIRPGPVVENCATEGLSPAQAFCKN